MTGTTRGPDWRMIFAIFWLGTITPASAAGSNAWKAEIEAISKAVESRHPAPFAKVTRTRFEREKANLEGETRPDAKTIVRAMRWIASIGDGHTQLEPMGEEFSRWYPIRPYEFADGVYVTSAHNSVGELSGARLLMVGGLPIAAALEQARDLMGTDNEFGRKENLFAITNAGLIAGLGLADAQGGLTIKARLRDGRTITRTLSPLKGDSSFDWRFRSEVFGHYGIGETKDWTTAFGGLPSSTFRASDHARPAHLDRRYFYVSRPLGSDTYYLQVNFVQDDENPDFLGFFKKSLDEVDRLRPKNLIIDWRYNSGGDGSKITAMIHQFIKREDSRPWKNLYVLVGRKTFSASIMGLAAFHDHVPVTFIGEPAGAALNHFGDADQISFKPVELRLSVSTLRHQLSRSDDTSAFVPIDVPAQFSFADYVAGRDPAVDPIVAGNEMRALPLIAVTDGGGPARAAYDDRRKRFGALDWWRAAIEKDMNTAGYALLRQRRIADALEVFAMNTEIYPTSWRVWDSLGEAQLAAGQREAGIASYRRSLAINPGNGNARMVLDATH